MVNIRPKTDYHKIQVQLTPQQLQFCAVRSAQHGLFGVGAYLRLLVDEERAKADPNEIKPQPIPQIGRPAGKNKGR